MKIILIVQFIFILLALAFLCYNLTIHFNFHRRTSRVILRGILYCYRKFRFITWKYETPRVIQSYNIARTD